MACPFCLSEHIPETTGMPLNLVTSDITAQSFRVSWSHAPGNVEKYRVVYYPTQGRDPGDPQEVNSVLFAENHTSNQPELRKSTYFMS